MKKQKINVDSIFTIKVKDIDAAGNCSVEFVFKYYDFIEDGKKEPYDEYIGKVFKMKMNQNGDVIGSIENDEYPFSVYPEEPKKIKDEWITVKTIYKKGLSEPMKIERKYVFSEMLIISTIIIIIKN